MNSRSSQHPSLSHSQYPGRRHDNRSYKLHLTQCSSSYQPHSVPPDNLLTYGLSIRIGSTCLQISGGFFVHSEPYSLESPSWFRTSQAFSLRSCSNGDADNASYDAPKMSRWRCPGQDPIWYDGTENLSARQSSPIHCLLSRCDPDLSFLAQRSSPPSRASCAYVQTEC
jgi:hypothetical protein